MQVGDLAPWLATPAARAVAALTLAILAVCLLIRALWPDGDGRYAGRDTKPLGAAYQELIGQGFVAYDQRTAEWEANADLFRNTIYARHGEPLRWSQALPSDIELVGLVYAPSISRHSTAILARVDNRPVVLFVDDRERDGGAASAGSLTNLNVFRQEHGRLVIYEVTPWDEPRLSLLLEPTDPPPDMCLEE
jgi:hypothetical protein